MTKAKWPPTPGWSGLPRTEADRANAEREADNQRRSGANFTGSTPSQGNAVVMIHDLGDGRFSSTINHDSGAESKEHGSFQNAIEHARRNYMEKQLAAKQTTMQSDDQTQAARGNTAGSRDAYSTR